MNLESFYKGINGYTQWKIKNKIKSPYCIYFNSNQTKIYLVGVQHSSNPESDTFTFIKKIINKKIRIDLILLEGIDNKLGINYPINNWSGEGNYAISLAKKKKINYIGLEESDKKILTAISKKYSREDILGYDFLRTHKYFYSNVKGTLAELLEFFKQRNIYQDTNFKPLSWFLTTFSKKFSYRKHLEYASPLRESKIITRCIGYEFSNQRNIGFVRNILKSSKEGNIVCIMGENHVYDIKGILFNKYKNINVL